MSSGFGINSKPRANSSAYVNSPYWDKKKVCSYCKGTKVDPDNVTSAPLPCPACKEESNLKDDTGMTWLRDNNTHLNGDKKMPEELWRDLELEEKILPGDRCCGADHKWFELKEEHLTFRHIMSEQSYPTQRKVIPISEADFLKSHVCEISRAMDGTCLTCGKQIS